MIESTFNPPKQKESIRERRSAFIDTLKQVSEGGSAKGDKRERESHLHIFQRSDQKKSLDQLVDNEITYLVKNSTSPILVLPPDYQMDLIGNIVFVGNAEGLSDHPLLHKIAAHFLPKPYRLNNGELELIHWNNVFQIPAGIPAKHQLTPRQLNRLFKKSNIHMVVLPIPQNRPWWRSLWEISFLWSSAVPVLVMPL